MNNLSLESIFVSKSKSEIEKLLPQPELVSVVGSLLQEDGFQLILEGLPLFVFGALEVLSE